MKRVFGAVVAAAMLAGCQARPVFSQQDIDRAELGKGLGAGFLLGTATAAHQVEGGQDNNWTEWERTPLPDGSHRIHDGSVSGVADDMWNRFESDVTLMKRLGTNSYRLSVEWSRLEPREGVWNDEAANRYLSWMQTLRANGITPMVTLYHWTLPKWVAAQGGWENDKTIADFAAFSGRVAAKLGAHVDLWCTLNEPNVYMTQSYIKALHPPGKADQKLAAEVLNRLMEAHARSVKAVRDNDTTDADGDGKATQVGIAHHLRIFQPSSSSMMDSMIAGLTDDFFNESFITAYRTGRVELHIPGSVNISREVEGLKGSFDYLGINYYTRDYLRADLTDPSLSKQYVPENLPKNDSGWELYPEGLYMFLQRYKSLNLPIYITENGMDDRTGDKRRAYLRAHFYALQRAVQDGANVRGYYHWSLIDNFEWQDGFVPRFGLYHVDRASSALTRTPTDAVPEYQAIARNLGLTPAP